MFPDNRWKNLTKELASPYDYFNSIKDYEKPVDKFKTEDFFSKFKKCPSVEKKRKNKRNNEKFNIKNGEKLTQLYLKSDVFLLACVFGNFIRVSANEFGINPLHCVSVPGYT